MSASFGGPSEKRSDAHDTLTWHIADRCRRSATDGLQLRPWVRRWLIDSGFATVERDGSLKPTQLGAEVGRAVAAAAD
jgi:hypothetical protein